MSRQMLCIQGTCSISACHAFALTARPDDRLALVGACLGCDRPRQSVSHRSCSCWLASPTKRRAASMPLSLDGAHVLLECRYDPPQPRRYTFSQRPPSAPFARRVHLRLRLVFDRFTLSARACTMLALLQTPHAPTALSHTQGRFITHRRFVTLTVHCIAAAYDAAGYFRAADFFWGLGAMSTSCTAAPTAPAEGFLFFPATPFSGGVLAALDPLPVSAA